MGNTSFDLTDERFGNMMRSIDIDFKKGLVPCGVLDTEIHHARIYLTNATFPKEPCCYTDQEHHDNDWLIFHVAKKVHRSIVVVIIRSAALTSTTIEWCVLPGCIAIVLIVPVVVTVGVIRWQRFHRHL